MSQHVGRRIAECILLQQDGHACAPCKACQLVRDGLRRNASATEIIATNKRVELVAGDAPPDDGLFPWEPPVSSKVRRIGPAPRLPDGRVNPEFVRVALGAVELERTPPIVRNYVPGTAVYFFGPPASPTTLATPKNASARDVRIAIELRRLARTDPDARRFADQLADALLLRAVVPEPFR